MCQSEGGKQLVLPELSRAEVMKYSNAVNKIGVTFATAYKIFGLYDCLSVYAVGHSSIFRVLNGFLFT